MRPGVALWCAVLAGSAAAGTRGADWSVLNGLAPGTEIRVSMTSGKTVRGFLQKSDADSLSINATTSQETLARDDVKRVQSKRPGHRGRNTLIGLGVGMGGGLAVGAAIDHGTGGSWFPNLGKAVFTPVGAVVGTVIGVAIPTGGWREVYRAP
jgi:hypothetical protein